MVLAFAMAYSFGQTPQINVTELPLAGCGQVVVQAYVRARNLSRTDSAAWHGLAEILLQGSKEYTPSDLMQLSVTSGRAPHCFVFHDFLLLQVTGAKGTLPQVLRMMESFIRRPEMERKELALAISRLSERTDVWETALYPLDLEFRRARFDHVKEVHERLFRPENFFLVAAGDFAPGTAVREAQTLFEGWRPPRPTSPFPDGAPSNRPSRDKPVSTFEWRGTPIGPTEPEFTATLLAMIALGVGKQCSMHRVLREQNAWTYRQEAILWPTLNGWQPRLIAARADPKAGREFLEKIKQVLLADLEGWSEEHRLRALAMLGAAKNSQHVPQHLWPATMGLNPSDPEHVATWHGLQMLFNNQRQITLEELHQRVSEVELKSMKTAAQELLSKAQPIMILGRS